MSREVLDDSPFKPGTFLNLRAEATRERSEEELARERAVRLALKRAMFSERCWTKRRGKRSVLSRDMRAFHVCEDW